MLGREDQPQAVEALKEGPSALQRPKAGTTLAVGGKVNLVVGKGRRR